MVLINPEKDKLEALGKRVHKEVKSLKVGQKGYITCDKDNPSSDVISYLQAYALHKKKWFTTEYNATTKVLTATRTPPLPWPEETDEDDGLEEPGDERE